MSIEAVVKLNVADSTARSQIVSNAGTSAASYAVSATASAVGFTTGEIAVASRVTAGSTITSAVSAQNQAGWAGGVLFSQICSAVNSATTKVI